MTCKGICNDPIYSPKKIVRDIQNTKYRRCSKCSMCLIYDGVYCPCCCIRLKVSPRNNNARKKHSKTKVFL